LLTCEYRNRSLWDLVTDTSVEFIPAIHRRAQGEAKVSMPIGTILKVARIFIRQGAHNYDSVTFTGGYHHHGTVRKVRFWVSLKDANNIQYKVI
jgi:hypothetical protein